MKNLWNKFDRFSTKCYSDMIQDVTKMDNWNNCFDILLEIIKKGREQNPDFAKELYLLDDDTEFSHDVGGWMQDYLDELDMRQMYDELQDVCKKVIELFEWKEDAPSDFYYYISSTMRAQGKHKEALEFCEEWYAKDSDNITAAMALIYSRTAMKDWDGAEQVVKKYIDEEMLCTEDNDIIYTAAECLYKASGNKKAEKKITKAMKEYEKRLEEYFMGMDDDMDIDLEDDELPFS